LQVAVVEETVMVLVMVVAVLVVAV